MKSLSQLLGLLLRRGSIVLESSASRQALLVLMYHRVLAEFDPLLPTEPPASSFAAEIGVLASLFTVLPLSEAIERLYRRSLPVNAACITFDDGYANNFTHAAPILQRYGVGATFFVATGFIGRGRMWNDTVLEAVRRAPVELDLSRIGLGRFVLADVATRCRTAQWLIGQLKYLVPAQRDQMAERISEIVGAELPTGLMMSEFQVKQLAGCGMEVGAHTVSHPILALLDETSARREITMSKVTLGDLTGAPVQVFAYPNGYPGRDYQPVHVAMVRAAGFAAAVSTVWGACHSESDRFQLLRLRPAEKSSLRFAARLLYARRQRDRAIA